jgi:hypothetical protein
MLWLEARLDDVQGYITRLRVALAKIDKELWPEDTLQNDLESMMTRLNEIHGWVQAWKKSTARCGADVALSLVRFHCKDAKEEKLKALQVANTKKLQFEDFMETFVEAATRIADGIDLDTFVEPVSPTDTWKKPLWTESLAVGTYLPRYAEWFCNRSISFGPSAQVLLSALENFYQHLRFWIYPNVAFQFLAWLSLFWLVCS